MTITRPDGRPAGPAALQSPPGAPTVAIGSRPDRTDLAVSLHGATRRFGEVVAVEGMTFDVPAGTIVGLIGPSGSGKTTTIRLMTGALAPSEGRVRVLGEDPRRFHRSTRRRIGYMPQRFVLYPDLTTRENVDFVAAMFGMLWWGRRRRVREVLDLLGLWDARGRRASALSGGMQRRLELATALVHDPDLLFLDEPTAGIDPLLRKTVWDELRRLRDVGRTLLVTTQYVTEAEYCDRVALVANGRLIAFDAPEALRRMALGGEVLEVETARAFDAHDLPPIEGVIEARNRSPRGLLIVAENASTAAPDVVEAVGRLGGEVVASREYRPTFDEVFTELVDRDRNGGPDEVDGPRPGMRPDPEDDGAHHP